MFHGSPTCQNYSRFRRWPETVGILFGSRPGEQCLRGERLGAVTFIPAPQSVPRGTDCVPAGWALVTRRTPPAVLRTKTAVRETRGRERPWAMTRNRACAGRKCTPPFPGRPSFPGSAWERTAGEAPPPAPGSAFEGMQAEPAGIAFPGRAWGRGASASHRVRPRQPGPPGPCEPCRGLAVVEHAGLGR